jgi:hypothetical protein
MAQFNTPVIEKLWERDYQVSLKITGQYNTATGASNTIILNANTLYGANNSQPCYLDVTHIDYCMGLANGFVSIEFASANTSNVSNVTVFTVGKRSSGSLGAYVFNTIDTANSYGDLNLYTSNLDANDSFTIIVSAVKSVTRTPGAWINVEDPTPYNYQ